MHRLTIVAVLTLLAATPSLASGATCSTASSTQFKPKAALEAQLKSQGLKVRQIKVEGGCYEVYALDKAGKKVNVAFNAETLEQVNNPEAGEE